METVSFCLRCNGIATGTMPVMKYIEGGKQMTDLREVSKGFHEEERDQLKKLIEYVHGVDASEIKTMDYGVVLKIERKIHDIMDIIDKCKECWRLTTNLEYARSEEDVVKKMSGAFYYE